MLPLLLSLAIAGPSTTVSAVDARDDRPVVRVLMVLVSTDELPAPTMGLRREIERIWQSTGVEFRWAERLREDASHADYVITVQVTDAPADGVRIPAGAFGGVPIVGGRMRPMIYVSPSAVKALVTSAGVSPGSGTFTVLYSRTVARVIAHELGHVLLHSDGHRSAGLMRATFVDGDVVSGDADRFGLATMDVALVHERAAAPAVAAPEAQAPAAPDGSRRRR
jgi:Zn-dependent protease with chaperone function